MQETELLDYYGATVLIVVNPVAVSAEVDGAYFLLRVTILT